MTLAQIYAARIEVERSLRNREDALALTLLDKLSAVERVRMSRTIVEPALHSLWDREES